MEYQISYNGMLIIKYAKNSYLVFEDGFIRGSFATLKEAQSSIDIYQKQLTREITNETNN